MTEELNTVVRFNNVRIAFPHLYEKQVPKGSPGATPAFSADFIIDPLVNADEWKAFEQTLLALATNKWPEIAKEVLAAIAQDRKMRCYGKGQEKLHKTTMKPMDGFEGMLYVSGRNTDTVDIYNQQGKLVDPKNALDVSSKKIYGGCYVNMAVKLWPQDNAYGRAIRGELVAVQFLRDGEPFAAHKVDTSGMFAPVEGAPEPTAGSFEPEPGAQSFL